MLDINKKTKIELNYYNFRQKRFTHEQCLSQDMIESEVSGGFPQEVNQIFKHSSNQTSGCTTKYVAMSCVMDHQVSSKSSYKSRLDDASRDSNYGQKLSTKTPGPVSKVTLVNQNGQIVLDTLVHIQKSPNQHEVPSNEKEEDCCLLELGFFSSVQKPCETFDQDTKSPETFQTVKIRKYDEKMQTKLIKRLNAGKENNSAQITIDNENNLAIEIPLETLGNIEKVQNKSRERNTQTEQGITQELSDDAPSLEEVREHIMGLLQNDNSKDESGELVNVIIVGHDLKNQIDSLGLDRVSYIDTQQNFRHKSDQKGDTKPLSSLTNQYLNLEIKSSQGSSIDEARAAMAFFMHFKDHEEGFFSDKTIQVYDRSYQLEQVDNKEKKKYKKRTKKASQKEQNATDQVLYNNEVQRKGLEIFRQISLESYKFCFSEKSESMIKALVLGVGVCGLKLLASSKWCSHFCQFPWNEMFNKI